jgi:hypothetical protein
MNKNTTSTLNREFSSREKQEEYGFGPYLIEVTRDELIPPQYMSRREEILSADLAVKIPVNLDRKDVLPGMTLYRQMILMKDEMITILTIDNEIMEDNIHLNDISYIVRGGELLGNYIEIGTPNKAFRIDYFTVAEDITSRIIRTIREKFITMEHKEYEGIKNKALYRKPMYEYFLVKERSGEEFKIIAHQDAFSLRKYFTLFGGKYLNTLFKSRIEEVMFMTNGYELIVASDDVSRKNHATVNYSYRHAYIKLDDITDIRIDNDPRYENGKFVSIFTKYTVQQFNIDDNFNLAEFKEKFEFKKES